MTTIPVRSWLATTIPANVSKKNVQLPIEGSANTAPPKMAKTIIIAAPSKTSSFCLPSEFSFPLLIEVGLVRGRLTRGIANAKDGCQKRQRENQIHALPPLFVMCLFETSIPAANSSLIRRSLARRRLARQRVGSTKCRRRQGYSAASV